MAISIPIFTAQLEKAREGVDAANIRSAYAECAADILTDGEVDSSAEYSTGITLKQTTSDWQQSFEWPNNLTVTGTPASGGTFKITYDSTSEEFTCTIS